MSSSHWVTADTCFNAPAPRRGQVWDGAGVGDRWSGSEGRAAAGALPPQLLSGARETMERRRERPGRRAPGFAGEKDRESARPTVAASTSSQAPFLPLVPAAAGPRRALCTQMLRLGSAPRLWAGERLDRAVPTCGLPGGPRPGRTESKGRASRRIEASPGSGSASLSARLSGKAAPRLGGPDSPPPAARCPAPIGSASSPLSVAMR